ncbi:class I SAM-dependent methyltransferase [Actinoplanes sp. RD1]|uniref:class I SAM-dependent methyltransferase n=1 Tax=Actinoplanes sp. RD1 TaxID=3064538 RepID=UPI002741733E|nr:class I SAM-dependent methyltransferase [Actinoplanes sp. RD1]
MRDRTETQAFFAERAARWDSRFGDDLPAYTAAIATAPPPPGGTAIDVGCGTGRALPVLRDAVGPTGTVLGLDITPEMLAVAATRATAARALLALADASQLPLPTATADVIFAAGLVNHLPDPAAGLAELARVTRAGGTLILFHPIGRAALAARHGHALRPGEPLAEGPLRALTAATGWTLTAYEDGERRFLATARRVSATAPPRER